MAVWLGERIVYIDSGDSGASYDDRDQTIRVCQHLIKNCSYHIDNDLYYYLDHGGEHSEWYWQQRFWHPIVSLYPLPLLQPQPNVHLA
jgi:hypothetical protein